MIAALAATITTVVMGNAIDHCGGVRISHLNARSTVAAAGSRVLRSIRPVAHASLAFSVIGSSLAGFGAPEREKLND
jgi:hypothetical protein